MQPQTIDTLISARWVLPVAPHNCVLENYTVAIDKGRIIALLPTNQVETQFEAHEQLQLDDHILMPGLINAHTHAPLNLIRGLADDLPLMPWLKNHLWPAEQKIMNEFSVHDGTQLAILELLRGGITCFNDMYVFPSIIAKTCVDAGIRACISLQVWNVPTLWAKNEAEYLAKAIDTLKNGLRHPLVRWTLAPHAPYSVSEENLNIINSLSAEYNVPIHMHVHETHDEIEQSLKQYHQRPLQRLDNLDMLSSRLIAVHMTQLTEAEINRLQQTQVHVVTCPQSNLKLSSGFAPITQLIQAGVNVAIGTDSAASNNDLDMLGEMQTAALVEKGMRADPTALSAAQVLAMATINGAKALGLEQEIGSLEPGKAADMIAVDLSSYLTQPVYNPISQLVYATQREQVSDVWIAGKRLLKHKQFTELDPKPIVEKAKIWAKQAAPFHYSPP